MVLSVSSRAYSDVIGDGRRMRGCASWYDTGAAEITSVYSEWISR